MKANQSLRQVQLQGLSEYVTKIDQGQQIITGTCLLTHEEIKQLNMNLTAEELVLLTNNHPTSEDISVFEIICKAKSTIHYWLETEEFARLASLKTNLPYATCLQIFLEEAKKIEQALIKFNPAVNFIYTHKPEISEKLASIAAKYSQEYLKLAQEKYTMEMSEKLLNSIKDNPSNSNRLRVFATYFPESVDEDSAIVIELFSWHDGHPYTLQIAIDICDNLSAILVR